MPIPLMRILTVAGVAGAAWAWRNPERARQMWGRVQQRSGLGQRPAEGPMDEPGMSGMSGGMSRSSMPGSTGSSAPTSTSSAYAPQATSTPPSSTSATSGMGASTGSGSAGDSMSATTGPSPAGI